MDNWMIFMDFPVSRGSSHLNNLHLGSQQRSASSSQPLESLKLESTVRALSITTWTKGASHMALCRLYVVCICVYNIIKLYHIT